MPERKERKFSLLSVRAFRILFIQFPETLRSDPCSPAILSMSLAGLSSALCGAHRVLLRLLPQWQRQRDQRQGGGEPDGPAEANETPRDPDEPGGLFRLDLDLVALSQEEREFQDDFPNGYSQCSLSFAAALFSYLLCGDLAQAKDLFQRALQAQDDDEEEDEGTPKKKKRRLESSYSVEVTVTSLPHCLGGTDLTRCHTSSSAGPWTLDESGFVVRADRTILEGVKHLRARLTAVGCRVQYM